MKSLISLKTLASSVQTVFSLDNCDTITNLYDIADNNYFASIAETTKKQNIHINIFQTILQKKMLV